MQAEEVKIGMAVVWVMACESAAELDLTTSMSPPSQKAFVWQFECKEIKNKPVASTGRRPYQGFLNKDWEGEKLSRNTSNAERVRICIWIPYMGVMHQVYPSEIQRKSNLVWEPLTAGGAVLADAEQASLPGVCAAISWLDLIWTIWG